MGLANVSRRHGELVDKKYGKSPVGSLSSFQRLFLASLCNIRERAKSAASVMRKKILSGNCIWMKMTLMN